MNELQVAIIEALKKLIKSDQILIETQPKEECINHKLAQYLEEVLKKRKLLGVCTVDVEYDKYQKDEKKILDGRNIRPDAIVHERKSGSSNNLIVIEAKKEYGREEDIVKVEDLVDNPAYKYKVGAVISYLPRQKYLKIKFYESKKWLIFKFDKTTFELKETTR